MVLGMIGVLAGVGGKLMWDYFRGGADVEESKLLTIEPTNEEETASRKCENECDAKLEAFMKSLAGFDIYKLKAGKIVQFHCRKKIIFAERWKTILVTEEVASWDVEDPDVPKHIKELVEKDAVIITDKETEEK